MLHVRANIGVFHFSFSIRSLNPKLFTSPSPLIPIPLQPSRIENVFITCFLNFSGRIELVYILHLVIDPGSKNVHLCDHDRFISESAILLRRNITLVRTKG